MARASLQQQYERVPQQDIELGNTNNLQTPDAEGEWEEWHEPEEEEASQEPPVKQAQVVVPNTSSVLAPKAVAPKKGSPPMPARQTSVPVDLYEEYDYDDYNDDPNLDLYTSDHSPPGKSRDASVPLSVSVPASRISQHEDSSSHSRTSKKSIESLRSNTPNKSVVSAASKPRSAAPSPAPPADIDLFESIGITAAPKFSSKGPALASAPPKNAAPVKRPVATSASKQVVKASRVADIEINNEEAWGDDDDLDL